jgi:hypothetical protein
MLSLDQRVAAMVVVFNWFVSSSLILIPFVSIIPPDDVNAIVWGSQKEHDIQKDSKWLGFRIWLVRTKADWIA